MKQLIKGYENKDILDQTDILDFFINEVSTPDVEDKRLRIAVQSLKLADAMIKEYVAKLRKSKK